MSKMVLCTPAKTHLLIHLGNCSGLTDQLYRKYMWGSSLRKFVPYVRLINNEKKRLKFFSPKLSPPIQRSGKPVCWELGQSEPGGERGKAASTSSCPLVFYRSMKERATFSPTRYSWDEPSIPAVPETLPVQGRIPLARLTQLRCRAAACTDPIRLEALMLLAGALGLGIGN